MVFFEITSKVTHREPTAEDYPCILMHFSPGDSHFRIETRRMDDGRVSIANYMLTDPDLADFVDSVLVRRFRSEVPVKEEDQAKLDLVFRKYGYVPVDRMTDEEIAYAMDTFLGDPRRDPVDLLIKVDELIRKHGYQIKGL